VKIVDGRHYADNAEKDRWEHCQICDSCDVMQLKIAIISNVETLTVKSINPSVTLLYVSKYL